MSKTIWPTEVPVLSAEDICRDEYDSGSKHCLCGWRWEVFGVSGNVPSLKVFHTVKAEIKAETGFARGEEGFNDDQSVSLRTIARVWNRAMARLGYVVGNPEAKNVRK